MQNRTLVQLAKDGVDMTTVIDYYRYLFEEFNKEIPQKKPFKPKEKNIACDDLSLEVSK